MCTQIQAFHELLVRIYIQVLIFLRAIAFCGMHGKWLSFIVRLLWQVLHMYSFELCIILFCDDNAHDTM